MNAEADEAVRQWRAKAQSDWTAVEILLGSERCPQALWIHSETPNVRKEYMQ